MRIERNVNLIPILVETLKDAFIDKNSKINMELEFSSKKPELEVYKKPKKWID